MPTPNLLDYSARIIDTGTYEGPGAVNRPSGQLSELADGIAIVEAFSHVVAFESADGLVLFDTSLEAFAPTVLRSLRSWRDRALHTAIYTHGHIDHVGGMQAFIDDARERGRPRPRVVGHARVSDRFARYERTQGYNAVINARQFGGGGGRAFVGAVSAESTGREGAIAGQGSFGPKRWVRPDTWCGDRLSLQVGELAIELRHHLGETDDHLWAWIPEKRAVCAGDFVLWVFPNAGNPQKVQRYPLEWAQALREMAALEPELLLPAHGLPVGGRKRVATLLGDTARVLELLVEQTLALMNDGARLDDIVHSVRLPEELTGKPYLRATYDEPEFVVRNIWRLYGGWYDGDPSHLKPAPAARLASELAALAGGAAQLVRRARELSQAGEHRLACHLAELAIQAAPADREAHAARAEVFEARRVNELSLMARGIYGAAVRESKRILESD